MLADEKLEVRYHLRHLDSRKRQNYFGETSRRVAENEWVKRLEF
ncbi:hypothetical protein NSP_14890 [Nodularia spumigena CCY9414]|nr:hypothetical protein NSP_14890 [Nodularia spumigena CCY9414]